MSRHRIEIEKNLLRIEFLLEQIEPGSKLSAEAVQGIERQLRAALPREQRRALFSGYRSTTAAVNRLVNMFMAVLNGKPGVGEFDTLRKAVVVAAKEERQRWDIMAEAHAWLHEGRSREDILSQVEDRFGEMGIQVIWEFDGLGDNRFTFEGEGQVASVVYPAYVIAKDEHNPITIKRGLVSLAKKESDLRPWPQDHTLFPEKNPDPQKDAPGSASDQNINQSSLEEHNSLADGITTKQETSPEDRKENL